jgi:phosphoribosylanthranilate isomerase
VVRVKICGLAHLEDALLAAEAGADLLGFVFYAKSPRCVAPQFVRQIIARVKSDWPQVACVGVFVDERVGFVSDVMGFCGLDRAQLHGRETPASVSLFQGRAYKAIRPQTIVEAMTSMAQYAPPGPPPDLLVDPYDPKAPGGTGQRGDWDLAARIAARRKILLAGGLSPDNVAEAIRRVRPWGVDVSSGVEASPGRKSPEAVRAFIAAARNAGAALGAGQTNQTGGKP